MNNRLFTIICALTVVTGRAQTNVLWAHLTDFGGSNQPGVAVTMSCANSVAARNPILIHGIWVRVQPITHYTDANGMVSFCNVPLGQWEFDDAATGTFLTCFVNPSTTGSNNIAAIGTNVYNITISSAGGGLVGGVVTNEQPSVNLGGILLSTNKNQQGAWNEGGLIDLSGDYGGEQPDGIQGGNGFASGQSIAFDQDSDAENLSIAFNGAQAFDDSIAWGSSSVANVFSIAYVDANALYDSFAYGVGANAITNSFAFNGSAYNFSFAFADSTTNSSYTATNNQFAVYATGGIRLEGGPISGNGSGLANLNYGAIIGHATNNLIQIYAHVTNGIATFTTLP